MTAPPGQLTDYFNFSTRRAIAARNFTSAAFGKAASASIAVEAAEVASPLECFFGPVHVARRAGPWSARRGLGSGICLCPMVRVRRTRWRAGPMTLATCVLFVARAVVER